MPDIHVTASEFLPPFDWLNGTRDVHWSEEEVLHAAMTTGKLPHHFLMHGVWSVMELVSRASLVVANLRLHRRRFVQSEVYRFSDRSEKAATSYYLGQTLACLFAGRFLDTPFVMSVDRYWRDVGVKWSHPRMRPDLLGWGPGGWAVIEAKGRTHGLDSVVIKNALAQKNTVATIGGVAPTLRLAAATHFSAGQLALRVVDPPADVRLGPSEMLPGEPSSYLRAYYQPFVEAASVGEEAAVLDRRVRLVTVPGFDVRIGVDVEIIEAFGTSESALTITAERLARQRRTPISDGVRVSHQDSITIEPGSRWSEDQLTREPWEREP